MIAKIYQLYEDAYKYEMAEKERKEAYSRPKNTGPRVVMEEHEDVIDWTQDSGIGQQIGQK